MNSDEKITTLLPPVSSSQAIVQSSVAPLTMPQGDVDLNFLSTFETLQIPSRGDPCDVQPRSKAVNCRKTVTSATTTDSMELDIEKIFGKRRNGGEIEYLVSFKNTNSKQQEWVTRKKFPNISWLEHIEAFECQPLPTEQPMGKKISSNELQAKKILEKRKQNGKIEYLLLWKNSKHEIKSWATRENMPSLNWIDLVENFELESLSDDVENEDCLLNVPLCKEVLQRSTTQEAEDLMSVRGTIDSIEKDRYEGNYAPRTKDASTNEQIAARDGITSFVDPLFKKLKNRYLVLKSDISKEKDGTENYVDVEEMNKELDLVRNEIESCYQHMESMRANTKLKIESNPDPNSAWPTAIMFKDTLENVGKKMDGIELHLKAIRNKYKTSPEAVLARKTKKNAVMTGKMENMEKYKLPIKLVCKDEKSKIRRYDLGVPDFAKPHKTLMMVGMTGAGKSLMINNIINYVYGVSYEDKFRFELIVDKEEIAERGGNASKSKADSMTSWVTGFNLNFEPGFRIPFNLTIIDTPGFGDTRGIKYDEIIVDQIREFFQSDQCCPVKEITCVGFVIQASTARITDDQKYVFDQVLNVFGKDMSENVFLLFTFADAQPAPALEVVKSHQIPFAEDCVFKFNNSALFAPNTNLNAEFSWNFGYNSLKEYFHSVGGKTPTSLTQTLDVLEERDYLKLILGALKPKIDAGMDILQSIESMIQNILELRGTAQANKDYKVKRTTHPQTTKVVNHHITNCKSCMFTCHDPCYIAGDNKEGCASMRGGKCGVCPGGCPWDMHSNGDRIYVYTEVEDEETIEDMCQKYNVAINDKNAKKTLLLNLFEEYKAYKAGVFEDISRAADAAKRLEEIALKNTFLTNVSYIERLIKAEEMASRPNKKNRLEQLHDVLQKAKILEDAKNNPETLTGHVNNYEATVLDKINNIQDEFTYDTHSFFRYSSQDRKKQNKKDKKTYIQSLKDGFYNINPWRW